MSGSSENNLDTPGRAGDAAVTGAVVPGGEPELAPQTIARAIAGDADALHEVWRRQRRWVAAVLLAHAPRDAEIDDLLQEVGLAMVAKISGLREPGAFKPWLRAVAMSIAKTSARRRTVRKGGWLRLVSLAGDANRPANPPATHAVLDAGPSAIDTGRRLLDLAAGLPDGYREPLLLKCIQGMSYKQIGQVMGLPDTTIETRIARARRMLKDKADAAGLSPTDPVPQASAWSNQT